MPTKTETKKPSSDISALAAELSATDAVKANAVKVTPGHGVAGRHATRELLDELSGNKDPRHVRPDVPEAAAAQGQRRQAAGAGRSHARQQPGRSGRQQPEYSRRLHLFRPVRRPRHHARPDLARRQGEGSARHREFPHPSRRPRLRLRPGAGWQPASLRAQSGRRQQARAEAADRQELQHRRRRLPQRSAAQPGGLRADRRPSQRREPAGRADASRDAEVPQQGLRYAGGRPESAGRHLHRGAPDRHLALSVDRAARLGRATVPKKASSPRSCTTGESSIASRSCPTCRWSFPRPPIVSATPWCASAIRTTGFQHAAGFRPVLPVQRPVGPHHWRSRRRAAAAFQPCHRTGSSTGGASTNSATAAARRSP